MTDTIIVQADWLGLTRGSLLMDSSAVDKIVFAWAFILVAMLVVGFVASFAETWYVWLGVWVFITAIKRGCLNVR